MVQRGCFLSDSEVECLLDLCQGYEHTKKDYDEYVQNVLEHGQKSTCFDTLEKIISLKLSAEAVVKELICILDKIY